MSALDRSLSVLTPLALLAIWEIAAGFGAIDTAFFPAPTAILAEFYDMLRTGELFNHTMISLVRIIVGFSIGTAIGIALGLAIGLNKTVAAMFQPLIDMTFPIPKVGLLPLVIILFGLGEASKYVIIAISCFYLVVINTVAGVRQIDRIYLDVGRNYHANRRLMFMDVALPGALPTIMAGVKISMGVSLIIIVSAESLAAKSGIGFLIWTSWQVFQVEKMYVGLFVSALLGLGFTVLLNWVERKLIPWKRH
jgi:ABC-type nitrate/sulfonate/bicarbonate transport system permease component